MYGYRLGFHNVGVVSYFQIPTVILAGQVNSKFKNLIYEKPDNNV